eukprot:1068450-Pyramimonas_sp.AAC.1
MRRLACERSICLPASLLICDTLINVSTSAVSHAVTSKWFAWNNANLLFQAGPTIASDATSAADATPLVRQERCHAGTVTAGRP